MRAAETGALGVDVGRQRVDHARRLGTQALSFGPAHALHHLATNVTRLACIDWPVHRRRHWRWTVGSSPAAAGSGVRAATAAAAAGIVTAAAAAVCAAVCHAQLTLEASNCRPYLLLVHLRLHAETLNVGVLGEIVAVHRRLLRVPVQLVECRETAPTQHARETPKVEVPVGRKVGRCWCGGGGGGCS